MDKIGAVIVAGGTGSRMGMSIKKQYILLEGKEVLAHTVEVFENSIDIEEIVVVVGKGEEEQVAALLGQYGYKKVKAVVAGGKERQDSVYNGLKALDQACNYVVVHDGARPFLSSNTLDKCLAKVRETDAVVVAVPVKDTIKVVNRETKVVEHTPERATLWSIQTPQVFQYDLLREAHQYAKDQGSLGTDDSMLVEQLGHQVYVVEGEYTNIKITTPEDIELGQAILKKMK